MAEVHEAELVMPLELHLSHDEGMALLEAVAYARFTGSNPEILHRTYDALIHFCYGEKSFDRIEED